jgi:hypothetical protein
MGLRFCAIIQGKNRDRKLKKEEEEKADRLTVLPDNTVEK